MICGVSSLWVTGLILRIRPSEDPSYVNPIVSMENGIFSFSELCYFLLIIVNFLLNFIYSGLYYSFFILKVILQQVFHVNMTEKSKKRKRSTPGQPNQTYFLKRVIDENWQKLLSSNLMEAKTEKAEDKKDHFTGVFRRARKKNSDVSSNVRDLKCLNLCNKPMINHSEQHKNSSKCDNEHNKQQSSGNTENNDCKTINGKSKKQANKLTKFIAMDCEMVGIGYEGGDHMLARVSLVNKFGDCIYDKFVKPREEVVDYRTKIR